MNLEQLKKRFQELAIQYKQIWAERQAYFAQQATTTTSPLSRTQQQAKQLYKEMKNIIAQIQQLNASKS